jgi:hypothetical protein
MFVWFRCHPSLLANALSSICDIIFGIVRIVISPSMYWLRTSTRLNTRKMPDSTKQTVPAVEGVALSFMSSFPTFKTPRQKSLHLVRTATNSYFQSSGAQVVCFTSHPLKSGRALWWIFMVMLWILAWTAQLTRVNVESTVVLGLYGMDTLCT